MNIILVTKRLGSVNTLSLSGLSLVVLATIAFLAVPVTTLYLGYQAGIKVASSNNPMIAETWNEVFSQQKQEIAEVKRDAEDNLSALALKLGQMQAHVTRLDALGQRLVEFSDFNNGEFNFSQPPARGGPQLADASLTDFQIPDFLVQLDELTSQLDDRQQQLSVLESVLINQNLHDEVIPTGRPILKGWVSSRYGKRADPFTGKQEFHKGIDLAGKQGSEVIAVASGVVMWSGERYGYGKLIEINHGNGYVTRYGHNELTLVNIGDTVRQGQQIATMGSSGRSTGPHVHFEVWNNGRTEDPIRFIQGKVASN
jgi:murein DD-endopeptidase MepM/ murein hydrolase activator NlpD